LSKLKEYNIDITEAIDQIQSNRHTRITTIYYLILKSYIRKGGKSVADKFSKDFIEFANLSNDEKK